MLLFNILNRGHKGAIGLFNADMPAAAAPIDRLETAGDGWMQRQGYTTIWFGWQADVLPGDGRMTLTVPVRPQCGWHARDRDRPGGTGGPTRIAATTLNLSSGWFTLMTHASAPTVSTDNQTKLADGFLPVLTVRASENAPRTTIPNTDWHFGELCGQQ